MPIQMWSTLIYICLSNTTTLTASELLADGRCVQWVLAQVYPCPGRHTRVRLEFVEPDDIAGLSQGGQMRDSR